MDTENLQLQRQLHDANQERMASIEREQHGQREILNRLVDSMARVEENTRPLPLVHQRLSDLEDAQSRVKGAMWILGMVWTGLMGGLEFLFHHKG